MRAFIVMLFVIPLVIAVNGCTLVAVYDGALPHGSVLDHGCAVFSGDRILS